MHLTEEVSREVTARVEERSDELVGLLRELVSIRSVNPVFADSGPLEEGQLQRYLADRLGGLGFETDLWEPDPEELKRYRGRPGYQENRYFEGRPNLAATLRGRGGGKSVMLASHIDVVGVSESEDWRVDPFGGEILDGRLYGRGSADMKGGAACMLAATEALLDLGMRPGGDVVWASVVDEETGGMGSLALVHRGYKADAAFMPEPTNLQIIPMCRGILWGEITVRGRSGHIEVPQDHWREGGAVDAIAKTRYLLDAIDELNEDWAGRPEKNHPLLNIPNQTFVSMVEAGQHPSSWAEEAKIVFDAQYTANERDANGMGGDVKRQIENHLSAAANGDDWLAENPPNITWTVDADCAEIPVDHPFVNLLQEACARVGIGGEVSGTGFHTDSSLLIESGTPTVVFGPAEVTQAHQTNESVALADLVSATKAMAITMVEWGAWS